MYFNGCFIKVGKYEHIRALHHDGIIHCKTVKHFATIEDNQRCDILEGVTYTKYLGQCEISFKSIDAPETEYKRFGFAEDTRINNSPNEAMGNLFCMTGINLWDCPVNQPKKVHPHIKGFGNCFVLIHNSNEFVSRVKAAAINEGLSLHHGSIEYKDFSNFTGYKTCFQKDNLYRPESEYRFHFNYHKEETINLKVGDLTDISSIAPISFIDDLMVCPTKKDGNYIEFKVNAIRKVLANEHEEKKFLSIKD
jgi:hypothetical protein